MQSCHKWIHCLTPSSLWMLHPVIRDLQGLISTLTLRKWMFRGVSLWLSTCTILLVILPNLVATKEQRYSNGSPRLCVQTSKVPKSSLEGVIPLCSTNFKLLLVERDNMPLFECYICTGIEAWMVCCMLGSSLEEVVEDPLLDQAQSLEGDLSIEGFRGGS